MADIAAYLVDQLLPTLISAYARTLFAWHRRRGRALGIRDGQTGVVQRLCGDEFETQELLTQTLAALQGALAAAVKQPLSPEQLGLPGQGFQVTGKRQCAGVAGFSLHGAEHVVAGDRGGGGKLEATDSALRERSPVAPIS